MKYILFFTIVLFIALIVPELAFSSTNPPPPPKVPDQAPINGALGMLTFLAGVYGVIKLRARKSN